MFHDDARPTARSAEALDPSQQRTRPAGGTYINNAATSFPKPAAVVNAVLRALSEAPRDPGRSGGADDPTLDCRRALATLFDVPRAEQVILGPSATHGLNLVIAGCLHGAPPGAHAVVTALDHNSVLRPLERFRTENSVAVSVLEPDASGVVTPELVLGALRRETRLVCVTHASNVTGTVQPVEQFAAIAAERGLPLLVDAAQSAGCVPLSYRGLPGRVFVAFSGHKGLFGPAGTGGLIVPDAQIRPLQVGGTGVRSASLDQPADLPLCYEAGTPNLPGIAGLFEGVRFVLSETVSGLGDRRRALVRALRERLASVDGVTMVPARDDDGRTGIVSLTHDRCSPAELAYMLRESWGIVTRAGLHCAPLAHRALGTLPAGTLRVSLSAFNTGRDVDRFAEALALAVSR
jgi:cysteine desulfurase / selenocysteine lyase